VTERKITGVRLSNLANYGLPLSLLVFVRVFVSIKSVFLSPENLIGIVHQVSIIGIMAVRMTFVIMTGG
jgi:ribose/xylose/arabinose/galactoside ABC-type transport system permease subunit